MDEKNQFQPNQGQSQPNGQQPQFQTNQEQASKEVNGPKEDKQIGMLSHILGLFLGFIAPLIIYFVIDKNDKPFTKHHATEALNWQISIILAVFGIFISIVILFFMPYVLIQFIAIIFGYFAFIVIGILDLVFCIMGTVKASRGEYYRYPISIRLVKS